MDKETEELMKRCNTYGFVSSTFETLMGSCQVLLNMMKEKDVKLEDDPEQDYTNMAENISAKDVPKVLEMALKIGRSNKIKDSEIKNSAKRLMRTSYIVYNVSIPEVVQNVKKCRACDYAELCEYSIG
jgi:hypothetical protein